MNKQLVKFFDQKFYPAFSDKWDDKIVREVILKHLTPASIVLDVGAGRGRIGEMNFKEQVTLIEGIDPDPRVAENPLLHKGYVGLAEEMPFFNDERFDVIFCDNVLEHVEFPEKFYKEISRVLKKGGVFISKTPNRNHYVTLISRFTPLAFHKFINKIRGRDFSDTFKTFYRANSHQAQKEWGNQYGLKIKEIKFIEGRPEYMRMLFILYPFGLIYERLVNYFNMSYIKCIVVTVMEK